jgi:hypothetical protein
MLVHLQFLMKEGISLFYDRAVHAIQD